MVTGVRKYEDLPATEVIFWIYHHFQAPVRHAGTGLGGLVGTGFGYWIGKDIDIVLAQFFLTTSSYLDDHFGDMFTDVRKYEGLPAGSIEVIFLKCHHFRV